MNDNFDQSLKEVLVHEGGWSDHPSDPGGATMKGVTIATFRKWIDRDATKEDLRKITDDQIAHIYRKVYWNAVKGDELPSGIDYAVFDFGVNSGPSRAIKYLQAVLNVTQDGKIGPVTLQAVQSADADDVINALCDRRLAFLRQLKTWPTFGKGWSARVAGVRIKALEMAKPRMVIEPVKHLGPEHTPPDDPLPIDIPDADPIVTEPKSRNPVGWVIAAVFLVLFLIAIFIAFVPMW